MFSEWQQHDQLTNPQEDKGCDCNDQIIDPLCLSGNSSFVFALNDLTCLFRVYKNEFIPGYGYLFLSHINITRIKISDIRLNDFYSYCVDCRDVEVLMTSSYLTIKISRI